MKRLFWLAIVFAATSLTSCQENEVADSIEGKSCKVAFEISSFQASEINGAFNSSVKSGANASDKYDGQGAPKNVNEITIFNTYFGETTNSTFRIAGPETVLNKIAISAIYGENVFTAEAFQNTPARYIRNITEDIKDASFILNDECYKKYDGRLIANSDKDVADITITKDDIVSKYDYLLNSSIYLGAPAQTLHLYMKPVNNIVRFKVLDTHPSLYVKMALVVIDGTTEKTYLIGNEVGEPNISLQVVKAGEEQTFILNTADLLKANTFRIEAAVFDIKDKLIKNIVVATKVMDDSNRCYSLAKTINLDTKHFDVKCDMVISWVSEFVDVEIDNATTDLNW